MEQTREVLSEKEIKEVISKIRNCGRFEDGMISLARRDLEYGLTKTEIDIYLKEGFGMQQMKKLSYAIRKHGADFAKTIAVTTFDEQCMQIAIEFYEKGISIDDIKNGVLQKTSAYNLNQIYTGMLNAIKEAEKEEMPASQSVDKEYMEKVFADMKEIIVSINRNAEKYEQLQEQLREEKLKNQVQEKIKEANLQIEKQQETIEDLQNTVVELQMKIAEKEEEIREMKDVSTRAQTQIPVQYIAAIPGGVNQPMIQTVIERSKPKQTGMYALLGKLAYKKKSKQDIVRLVASGDLSAQQLTQIRSAMEKGLTEEQLLGLIHSNATPEQMKEIIEIAVLENSIN